ncbi:MAG: flagellar biosynthesis protein FlhF [Treponema sp.]|jgi:flagellar biosynthesis protein FlhF|nr:flagellar biosynthesis protein FlhF [Treponema sp.]
MAYFTEQALTPSECLEKIRSKYGERAKVLIQKTVRKGGILGIGSHEEVEMTGTYGAYSPTVAGYGTMTTEDVSRARGTFNLEEEKRKVLAAAGKNDPTLITILSEVRKLTEKVETRLDAQTVPESRDHPALERLKEDLACNDFSPAYIQMMIEKVRREFALEDLDDYEGVQRTVAAWIGETISIYREKNDAGKSPARESPPDEARQAKLLPRRKPRIIVLIGATGVGKTTTIAKLAALYGERVDGNWQKAVRLITLDNYRIGGKQQIEKYGEIMEIPVSSAENYEGLRTAIALYRQDVDYILVDTIGKSPRNYAELGEMRAVLDACGPRVEEYLCIDVSTKSSDIKEIIKQFAPFKYKSIILTKLDETGRVGNVISALWEEGKSVSFITTGQTVPSDIERATVMRFLLNLEGFTVDRERLSKRFPDSVNERFPDSGTENSPAGSGKK